MSPSPGPRVEPDPEESARGGGEDDERSRAAPDPPAQESPGDPRTGVQERRNVYDVDPRGVTDVAE